ncbi:MAG: radical SAM protein, partial [Verrucomicrobiales bacterium]
MARENQVVQSFFVSLFPAHFKPRKRSTSSSRPELGIDPFPHHLQEVSEKSPFLAQRATSTVIPNLRTVLKQTTSRCPLCQRSCAAEVWRDHGTPAKVWLSRTCPEHGEIDHCIASDARFHWLASGDPRNACGPGCACPSATNGNTGALGRNADKPGTPEMLATCLALIEIVDSCNLACPTCFADSPIGAHGDRLQAYSLESIQQRIRGVLDRKGGIEILQLSGGEPSLHPQLFELLDWIHAEPRIDYTLMNTNGLRLHRDAAFRQRLGEHARRGHFQLYLQYDGPDVAGQLELRGTDLRQIKHEVMELCDSEAIPFTLAMTVGTINLDQCWPTAKVGLRHEFCRGVSYQPLFTSGRSAAAQTRRLNASDVLLSLLNAPNSPLDSRDFTPLPCGDP